MIKTATRLSDGRLLTYYDAGEGHAARDVPDRRGLPPVSTDSELRYDPLRDAWVIYASHRQDRSYLPAADECPLCPSRQGRLTEVPAEDYEVVVFENRFPALGGSAAAPPAPGELQPALPAGGRCEVVCYTADHDASFADLSPARAQLVLEALVDRTAELSQLPEVEQVFCFENRGREIGVTQPHPHGQIYAYPFLPPRTEQLLASARAYARRSRRNLFEDLLAAEQGSRARVVLASSRWTAFVPHAARWPYEVHCYPSRRVPDLAALDAAERAELAEVELDLFGRFARLFREPAPYIAAWYQAPVREGRRHWALHLQLFTFRRADDKLKYLAGSESGMDAFANDILPEAAASRLRELGR